MAMLARARKHQYAAFIRDEGVLCVWSDNVKGILQEAEAIEELLLDYIWNEGPQRDKMGRVISARAKLDREDSAPMTVSESTVEGDIEDPEVSQIKRERLTRPTMVYESLLWQMLGPIGQIARNSRTYSAIAPRRTTGDLPHVTVWLPVYREALEEVIMPTVESLKAAQATYERQGGTVSILVCDDGLQLISPEQVEARKKFYFNNNIAYVARPGHGANGFERRGRFKKASNMNFAIQLSLRVEEILDDMRPPAQEAMGVDYFWCDDDEQALYEAALGQAIMESEGRAWADGNIRIGAVILIIDSDTRVPDDCFIDAVSEFEESLEVAIIQHSSGVMQVAHHFFENGIAHFTRGIQLSISFCCAGGTMGPFVGHNAFLRWSALQEIMFEEDGVLKVWSEAHVSEDFALSLALQLKGYIIRWATYSKDKFEEGVSLTCDDEVNRWQKYAWGCSELIFNPIRYWFTRGPFSRLFRQYLWSDVPLPGKISNLAYIFSYYAIACAWPMTVLNFVLIGFSIPVDAFYLNGWKILILVLIVFPGLGNLASIILRFRLKVPGTGTFARNQVTYLLFFSVFFTGLSMQILSALICHLVGYQMVWSATVKTVEASNFFKEVPAIIKKFKITLPINVLLILATDASGVESF
ncbi:hypothetical protein QFC22_006001 [Naganishia vaughanmartiniae]|uniref:Uncharacterized protein n=1 Tax=Naganishia vaughanmartiniae TaxID=1424756 RepID=A0ACC2WPZ5_9TREE|nr:hypothetical protein QFC22_006001 [Naganishia vaughanmartiniae]